MLRHPIRNWSVSHPLRRCFGNSTPEALRPPAPFGPTGRENGAQGCAGPAKVRLTGGPESREFCCELAFPAGGLARPAANLARPAANLARPAAKFPRPARGMAKPAAKLARSRKGLARSGPALARFAAALARPRK